MSSQSKIIAFIVGAGATLAAFLLVVLIAARADKIAAPQNTQGVLNENSLKSVKTKTEGLVNYGNLPAVVTNDEIGRDNPFDSY